ncbi:hypothetical protein S40288_04243 [Stachybotrys chartarum IBT 40288]|nr:hypothetical protein S40288_04243 [Stachybotrys chartarum IBT 40288]
MSSEYRIQRPYVLATLPRPLDHTDGRIVAREVYGQLDGQRKRKRTELVVGVDGETTSIYDVSASRLITSYPIPPQESFTCPPYCIRIRRSGSSDIARYTFITTKDSTSQKITLFKDVVHVDGKTTSTTTSQILGKSPVRYITSSPASDTSSPVDLKVLCQDGELVSLSGETLGVQWTASTKSRIQDAMASAVDRFEVEFVTSTSVPESTEGMFKNRPEIFTALPKVKDTDTELLVVVGKTYSGGQQRRHFSILAQAGGSSSDSSDLQRLTLLTLGPLPSRETSEGVVSYQLDAHSGLLLQLQDGEMSAYDLTGVIPKLKAIVQMDDAVSFTRTSRPFVLACSLQSIGLYNYQYRSIHAKTFLDVSDLTVDGPAPRSCQLLTHLKSLDLVVALVDNTLVSIHVEPPKSHGKRRKEGLLIDSIGRGITVAFPSKRVKTERSLEFSRQVPGTVSEEYLAAFQAEVENADDLLGNNDLDSWENLLRAKFQMSQSQGSAANGLTKQRGDEVDGGDGSEWDWSISPYPTVDRRWVLYAMSQVFTVDRADSTQSRRTLRLILPDSNVLTYLVAAGHLSLINLRSALRDDLDGEATDVAQLASDLIQCLTDADPSMTLLLNWLQATKLGEVELLLTIRALMLSMDLIPDTAKLNTTKLLTEEAHKDNETHEMDLDDLEREIAATEHHLGDDSDSRSRGLTFAFTKLWRLPALRTVKALRKTMQTEEILSFVYLLRVELIRGAWTSLYLDPTSFDSENNEAPPDGVIALIADLLGRCLDAVGAGGWLFNDAMSWADKAEAGDFITALKLEVMAALEGIEEALVLHGLVGEMVRYGFAVQKSGVSRQPWNANKPITLHVEGSDSRLLPVGLKTKVVPSREKVVSGGEVVQRSLRETGHLISQKVEPYSLEKLAI